MKIIDRNCVGKKQTCRLCGKEYICDYSYSCPHCEIETLVLDFIEDKEYCSDETMVGVSVGQLRKLAKYYRTHKLKVLQEQTNEK